MAGTREKVEGDSYTREAAANYCIALWSWRGGGASYNTALGGATGSRAILPRSCSCYGMVEAPFSDNNSKAGVQLLQASSSYRPIQ